MAGCPAARASAGGPGLEHAAAHLVLLDGDEEGAEVALAEALVALALDELEEDRPDGVGREELQQHLGHPALPLAERDRALAVDQDAVPPQPLQVLRSEE